MSDDSPLLTQALTHSSYAHEHGGGHNERLEFLGDAVLQFCITELLYDKFPGKPEGVLTNMRKRLVKNEHLARLALGQGLGERARLGQSEANDTGRRREGLLAGLYEAVLGATYLEHGLAAARDRVEADFGEDIRRGIVDRDPRNVLQEWYERTHGARPTYSQAHSSGPDHDVTFEIGLVLPALDIQVTGVGKSKGLARKDACAKALQALLAAGHEVPGAPQALA